MIDVPLTFVTSALITKEASQSCCLYKQVWEGSESTRDCFSDTSTRNCLSAPPESNVVGDCLLAAESPVQRVPVINTGILRK